MKYRCELEGRLDLAADVEAADPATARKQYLAGLDPAVLRAVDPKVGAFVAVIEDCPIATINGTPYVTPAAEPPPEDPEAIAWRAQRLKGRDP